MNKIDFPTDVFGSINDYFPHAQNAAEDQLDPRADLPPVESVDEFGMEPNTSHTSDAAPAVKNLPIASPLQAIRECRSRPRAP